MTGISIQLQFVLFSALGCYSSICLAREGYSSRQDLSPLLTGLLCQVESLPTDSLPADKIETLSFRALSLKIFDAQIEGFRVESEGEQELSLELLQKMAVQHKKRSYNGLAMGFCPSAKGRKKSAWVAYTPAPTPVVLAEHQIFLPKEVPKYCRSIVAYTAQRDRGRAEKIDLETRTAVIDLPKSFEGTLSYTCQSAEKNGLLPKLWYLIPIGEGPREIPPLWEQAMRRTRESSEETLFRWMELIRQREGLLPLPSPSTFQKEIDLSSNQDRFPGLDSLLREMVFPVDFSESFFLRKEPTKEVIDHDTQAIKKLKQYFESQKAQLLGEERSVGRDFKEMAWLLWNSPRHRNLLLHPKANFMAAKITKLDDQRTLLILIFARTNH
ncbi:MAG: hypothetical protein KA436_09015 [Oligoflexales bacterium]|nr:hypothetical protein [Oligoflexales bacterium]